MPTKSEIFAAYDGDPDAILDARPNLDPVGYAAFEASALRRLLASDVKAWERRQTVRIDAEIRAEHAGQERLVEVPEPERRERVKARARISTDQGSVDFLTLAGPAGAAILRNAANRDLPGALETVARRKRDLAIAALIESESTRLGRDVTVAEVLELVAA